MEVSNKLHVHVWYLEKVVHLLKVKLIFKSLPPIEDLLQPAGTQGAKKIISTACHSGKLKLAFTSPDIISTSPKSFLTSRIDFTVLLLFEFLKKHHLPVRQVKNRIH